MARPLRIVSYNVRYFGHALRGLASTRKSKEGISRCLFALEPLPDIICLQEVETISLRSNLMYKRGRPDQTQLESFMGTFEQVFAKSGRPFPYEAFYFRAHDYRLTQSTSIYTTGLAVLINESTLFVDGHNAAAPHPITHHHVVRFKDRKQSRICAHMRLRDLDGRPLHVFNTHLSLPTPFTRAFWSEKEKMGFGHNQVIEARSVADYVRAHAKDEPFIICGDFNSPPNSPVFRSFTEESCFHCAQAVVGQIDPTEPRGFPTAGFFNLRMHLDHLFSGGGVQWTDLAGTAAFGDRSSSFFGLSDHMPLIGRFHLSGVRPRSELPSAPQPIVDLDALEK
jgi:endonuclease/exonuclease/phosphatase family metal-dependent hydrolase